MREAKTSKFDEFIHKFATKNLETRVKVVALISLFLILVTVAGGSYLLTRTFKISDPNIQIEQKTYLQMLLEKAKDY